MQGTSPRQQKSWMGAHRYDLHKKGTLYRLGLLSMWLGKQRPGNHSLLPHRAQKPAHSATYSCRCKSKEQKMGSA